MAVGVGSVTGVPALYVVLALVVVTVPTDPALYVTVNGAGVTAALARLVALPVVLVATTLKV